MNPQGTKRKLELMAPGDIKKGAPNILRQKRKLSNSHFSRSAIADPSIPLQSGCRLGNYPREIMFNIMGHLGWVDGVCLGLTCTEMYDIYKFSYPSKVSLREWVETSPPSSFDITPKPTRVQLYQLLENWHGKHQYTFWRPNSSLGQASSDSYDQTIPARFLNKAVYDISLQNNSSETVKRNIDLRCRLGRNYQDYFFFKSPRMIQKNIDVYFQASPPGWLSPDDPESVFKGNPLPNPYNMGVEQWEKEATEVILRTIDVAYGREHWGWYWKNCNLWDKNFESFQKSWAERQDELDASLFSE